MGSKDFIELEEAGDKDGIDIKKLMKLRKLMLKGRRNLAKARRYWEIVFIINILQINIILSHLLFSYLIFIYLLHISIYLYIYIYYINKSSNFSLYFQHARSYKTVSLYEKEITGNGWTKVKGKL